MAKNLAKLNRIYKAKERYHHRIVDQIYRDPALLGNNTPIGKMLLKLKDPVFLKSNKKMSIVDVVFLCQSPHRLDIVAIEVKSGIQQSIWKGLQQIKLAKRDLCGGWVDWLIDHNIMKQVNPFIDYEVFLSIILLSEKFTKPIEEWVIAKNTFQLGELKRTDNLF